MIDSVNVIIANYQSEEMGDLTIDPTKGNCAFGSGKECWGFTLTMFAKIYARKFNTDEGKMIKRLWGDNYYDPGTKKWTKEEHDGSGQKLKRAFCAFIMDPLTRLARAIIEGNDA